MNKQRRKELGKLIDQLEEVKSKIETIKDEEESAYDNMPESLQDGDSGQRMQDAIDALDYAIGGFDDIIDNIHEAIDC